MSYDLKTLNPRHFKIIELCLRGITNKQIANDLSMTPNAVSIITSSPNFQREYAIQKTILDEKKIDNIAVESSTAVKNADTVKAKLVEATHAAVEKLTTLVNSEDETLAMKASLEVLDRGGHPKSTKVENVETFHISLSDEAADRLAKALLLDVDDVKNADEEVKQPTPVDPPRPKGGIKQWA